MQPIKLSPIVTKIIEDNEPKLPLGKWVKADKHGLDVFKDELFRLIQLTYKDIGGHHDFKSPNDIKYGDINYWEYIDIDADNDPDAISGAKLTPAGQKYVVGANDGSNKAKTAYILSRIQNLKTPGHYAEVSHKVADILLKHGIPVVTDENEVRKILKKDIEWVGKLPSKEGNGWYYRNVGGDKKAKIMVGKPKI